MVGVLGKHSIMVKSRQKYLLACPESYLSACIFYEFNGRRGIRCRNKNRTNKADDKPGHIRTHTHTLIRRTSDTGYGARGQRAQLILNAKSFESFCRHT